MKNLATTYVIGDRSVTLAFSDKDLYTFSLSKRYEEGENFFAAIGAWENHTVATGQDTKAWVTRPAADVLDAARNLMNVVDSASQFGRSYLVRLVAFLESQREQNVAIRHHYAWWYPKWVDRFRAAM